MFFSLFNTLSACCLLRFRNQPSVYPTEQPVSAQSLSGTLRMSVNLSLSSCPSQVYREIARHLAPCTIARCDLPSYLTPQRCCNLSFAVEVRHAMKSFLQNAQAALAIHHRADYLAHPCIRHNPIYIRFLTFN